MTTWRAQLIHVIPGLITTRVSSRLTGMERYEYLPIWQQDAPDLHRKVIDFWKAHGAIVDSQVAEHRVKQVVWVARAAADGQVAGVCTVMKRRIEDLHHDLYYYRTFVAPPYRNGFVVRRLLIKASKLLEDWSRDHPDQGAAGMYLELENSTFSKHLRQAVWPRKGLEYVYIGKTTRGLERRVLWFKHAVIAI
ncbi:MAG: hypothetical protein AAGH65_07845 [Pseudomonadota bacterium]